MRPLGVLPSVAPASVRRPLCKVARALKEPQQVELHSPEDLNHFRGRPVCCLAHVPQTSVRQQFSLSLMHCMDQSAGFKG